MKNKVLTAIATALLSTTIAFAKRIAPPEIAPLISGNYVYKVLHWTNENGTGQNGGYIEVTDAKTGMKAWSIQIYKTTYEGRIERDAQDVFISSIKMNFWGTTLIIKDELDRQYELDISEKSVTKTN